MLSDIVVQVLHGATGPVVAIAVVTWGKDMIRRDDDIDDNDHAVGCWCYWITVARIALTSVIPGERGVTVVGLCVLRGGR